jgi:hypothetical protein
LPFVHGTKYRVRSRAVDSVKQNQSFKKTEYLSRHGLGPVHANNGLALAARRAERKDCDEANTRCIREEHDAAIGPSGGQPREGFFNQGNVPFRPHCGVGRRLFGSAKRRSFLLALRAERHVRKPVISVNRPFYEQSFVKWSLTNFAD